MGRSNGVGQIIAGKKADLLVLDGNSGAANSVYAKLINAKETDVPWSSSTASSALVFPR